MLAAFLLLSCFITGGLLFLRRPEAAGLRDRFGIQPPLPARESVETTRAGPASVVTALQEQHRPGTGSERRSGSDRDRSRPVEVGPPLYRLWLADGQTIEARVVEERSKSIRVRHDMGPNGFFLQTIPRSQILNMAPAQAATTPLTSSDRRFAREFTGFHLYKRSPFTIVADESFGGVERNLRVLQSLHRQFLSVFGGVIPDDVEDNPIQVVFFRNETAFRDAATSVAPALARSSGFFDPQQNRLYVYNQLHSEAYASMERQIEAVRRKYETLDGGSSMPPALRNRLQQSHREAAGAATEATYRTIRHEAAHQLFFHYNLHATDRLDPTWLMEGLAMYCETPRIGRRNDARIEIIRELRDGRPAIPLDELLRYRGGGGWDHLDTSRALTAYAESWALVFRLMEPDLRGEFLAYLVHLRDSDVSDRLDVTDDTIDDLAKAVGIGRDQLIEEWDKTLRSL